MSGVERIAVERQRQIEHEGFTRESDLTGYRSIPGQMLMAAICYTAQAGSSPAVRDLLRAHVPNHWPWGPEWWKPGPTNNHDSRIRELEKAGALIAAEIDRLEAEIAEAGVCV